MFRFRWLRRGKAKNVVIVPAPETRHFAFFGGRRYFANAPYILPKDKAEMDRLDFQHYMLRYALRGGFVAPIGQPQDVLDVGCGSGRWPIEIARSFPDANVIGLDMTPPSEGVAAERPENCVFVDGNVVNGLPFPDASFDFVHQRLLVGALASTVWPHDIQELARVTRSGGWVELVEAAPALGNTFGIATLRDWIVTITAKRGVDSYIHTKLEGYMKQARLQHVIYREYRLPIGKWGGRLGEMAEVNYLSLYESLRGLLISQGLTDPATFDSTLQQARTELATGRNLWPYYVVYGQRQ